jgi:hypothetical protein
MPNETPQTPADHPAGPNPVQLKNALKAFKKRLKLTRLDDESRLGRGAMTTGGHSGIVAIVPPNQFPQAVWDELTRQNKIRRAGLGTYELVEAPHAGKGC